MQDNNSPTSAKVINILESGHTVEMWYGVEKNTRIILSVVDDGNSGTVRETRVRDGEEIASRTIGQPEIDSLVESRTWTVNKD